MVIKDAAEQRGGDRLGAYRSVTARNQRAQDMGEKQLDLLAGAGLAALGIDQRRADDGGAGESEVDDALLGFGLGP